jgi:hypothetical protein
VQVGPTISDGEALVAESAAGLGAAAHLVVIIPGSTSSRPSA